MSRRPRTPTRERLKRAAARLFAERGFEATTVQAIAREARSNIAAVNYHFGSKGALYAEFVTECLETVVGRMPRLADDLSKPTRQLRRFVQWSFERHRPGNPLRHFHRESTSLPRDFLVSILEPVVRPEFEACHELVAALLPVGTRENTIRRWTLSIIAVCVAPVYGEPLFPRLYPEVELDDAEVNRQVDHVCRFVLDGLQAEARRGRAKGRPPTSP